MDELLDMIATDESPSQISDKIKDLLFAKSAERVDSFKDYVGNSMFGGDEIEDSPNEYVADEESEG
jgi:hypothetical protein